MLFNLHTEYFSINALEMLGDFRIGRKVLRTVKYADYHLLLAKEETVIQGVVGRLEKLENVVERK
jgi:hypothetical protein